MKNRPASQQRPCLVHRYDPVRRAFLVLGEARDGRDDSTVYATYWAKAPHGRPVDQRLHGKSRATADAAFERRFAEGPPTVACRVYDRTDSQKNRFYAWENDNIRPPVEGVLMPRMAQREMTAYLTRLLNAEGVDGRAKLSIAPAFDGAAYCGRNGREYRFRIEATMCTRHIGVHEVAHAVIDHRYGAQNVEDHGPEFVALFLDMVERHLGMDRARLKASALEVELLLIY